MSSVRKRILPRTGEVRWQVDYRDQAGKRRAKQFATKARAVSYETAVRSEIDLGTHVADSDSITVEAACYLWIARGETEGLEPSTLRQYRQHVKHHIVPLIGATRLSRLKKPAVEEFRDRLVQSRSRALARAVLTSLKGILKEAGRRGLVGHNAAAETEVRLSKRDKARIEIPTKDEIRAILSKSAEFWPLTRIETTREGEKKVVAVAWRPLLVTAIFTGLRCSELRGLAWSHVDFEHRLIRVRQRADFESRIGPPKSEAGNRDIPMSPMVLNTLKEWKLACPATPLNVVFPTESGTIHSNSNLHKHYWGPLQRKLGLAEKADGERFGRPRYRFHALRHVAATLFIEQGWSPKKVQAIMGHSSIQVTFDTYGHLWENAEDDAKAMAQIEARLLA
jgi:integrase